MADINSEEDASEYVKTNKKSKRYKSEAKSNYDEDLFEKLRVLRRNIAIEKKVPPFIIFGDVSLIAMASKLPRNKKEFLEIKGVGQQKLKDFGNIFLETINEHLNEHLSEEITRSCNSKMAPIMDYQQRLEKIKENFTSAYESWSASEQQKLASLYYQKKSIDEIADVLARQPGAIRSRLRKMGLIIG